MSTTKIYVLLDEVLVDDQFDLAHVRVGYVEDDGIVMHIPVPKNVNNEWLDKLITEEIMKLVEYLQEEDEWHESQRRPEVKC